MRCTLQQCLLLWKLDINVMAVCCTERQKQKIPRRIWFHEIL